MVNIEELFERLTQNPDDPSEIRKLINQSEDLYLECKTISQSEINDNKITKTDSDAYFNYGKVVSAFANAEGGVVIWGLYAKEQKKGKADLIHEEKPITCVNKIKTDFDAIIGRVVSRRVTGVQNRIVYTNRTNDIGFIVTYIPASDDAPHRVEGKHKKAGRYYRRHGSGSLIMEHYELEEMFGRRRSPKLRLVLMVTPRETINGDIQSYNLKFGLKNVGKAIAKYPFLKVIQHSDLDKDIYGIDSKGGTGLPLIEGSYLKYQGGVSDVIHIGDILWIDQFIARRGNYIIFLLKFGVACDGFQMNIFDIVPNINYMASPGTNICEYEPGEDNLVNR